MGKYEASINVLAKQIEYLGRHPDLPEAQALIAQHTDAIALLNGLGVVNQ